MIKFSNVLVVVAHPDDEVLGCGGLLAYLSSRRLCQSITVLYLNNGYSERDPDGSVIAQMNNSLETLLGAVVPLIKIDVPQDLADIDKAFSYSGAVGKYLGVCFDFQSSKFETYPQNMFNDVVSKVADLVEADCLITHAASDLHKDHRIVNEAVMVAGRFKPESRVKTVLTFETISSSDINPIPSSFRPNLFISLTKECLDRKVMAMSEYSMEQQVMLRNRGKEAITSWASFNGLKSNSTYAEAYEIIRSVAE